MHLTPETLGAYAAGASAVICALLTTRAGRKSDKESTSVTEAASQREFQLAFLKTLQDEISKLGAQRASLQAELATVQNSLDSERTHRRALETQLAELINTIERLQAILQLVPAVLENPDIQRFLNTDYTP